MTGAELIQHLVAFGPEKLALPIIIRGYEGGHNEVSELEIVNIAVDFYADPEGDWLYGRHRILDDGEDYVFEDERYKKSAPAVHLIGKNP
jgi:hypothetical protein